MIKTILVGFIGFVLGRFIVGSLKKKEDVEFITDLLLIPSTIEQLKNGEWKVTGMNNKDGKPLFISFKAIFADNKEKESVKSIEKSIKERKWISLQVYMVKGIPVFKLLSDDWI